MRNKLKWSNIKIGGKYAIIFSFITIFFLIAILVTGIFIKNSSDDMDETLKRNEVATNSAELVTLFHEKYLLIPEYLLLSDEEKLKEYLEHSISFVNTAKELKKNLDEDQLKTLNQIIENNHELDEYFFSTIVPKVQQIDTEEFQQLQQEANKLKIETAELGDKLADTATKISKEEMKGAKSDLEKLILTLIISTIFSIFISLILLVWMSRKISNNLNEIVLRSNEIASGQLNSEQLTYVGNDEIGQLSSSINSMGQSLREMISEISNVSSDVDRQSATMFASSEEVKLGSQQIAISIEEMANGSSSQADSAATISQKTNEFTDSILKASEGSEQLVRFSDEVLKAAEEGDHQMKESLEQMSVINHVVNSSVEQVQSLENKTNSITEIVGVIKSIADQTNLLALNASIEAARAGEAGKSFAVVATEVRKLAEEVSNSVEGISSIIFTIKEEASRMAENLQSGFSEVNKGTKQLESTGLQFAEIKEKVSEMYSGVKMISSTLTDFQQSSQEMNENIEDIAAISEESAASSEEISAAIVEQTAALDTIAGSAKNLTDMVERMNQLIKKFKF